LTTCYANSRSPVIGSRIPATPIRVAHLFNLNEDGYAAGTFSIKCEVFYNHYNVLGVDAIYRMKFISLKSLLIKQNSGQPHDSLLISNFFFFLHGAKKSLDQGILLTTETQKLPVS